MSNSWTALADSFSQAFGSHFKTNDILLENRVARVLLKTTRMAIGIRILFYLRYYLVPQASFGLFLAAETVFLYGLYRAFVAP
jgi:hypothetical protein